MEIVLRAAAIYLFLWLATKALGKRELAQLSTFELILIITMGDLVQQGVTGDDRSITGAVIAVSTMSVMIVVSSLVSFKSNRLRTAFEGLPVVVVRDGVLLTGALRAERLTRDDVTSAARDQGIDDLRRIRIGILEPEGKFSFILHAEPLPQQTTGQQEGSVT